MPVDHEKFSNVAAGVQSIATTVGLVIAGAWVAYTFWALGSTNKARAEIAALEQTAFEQPILQITILPAAPYAKPSGHNRRLDLSVKLENSGKRAVEFSAPKVYATPLVTTNSDAKASKMLSMTASATILLASGKFQPMPSRVLRAGQSRTVVVSVPVARPGTYFVQVESEYYGMKVVDGVFKASNDEPIHALEQALIDVK